MERSKTRPTKWKSKFYHEMWDILLTALITVSLLPSVSGAAGVNFQNAVNYTVAGGSRSVTTGDFNGDGIPDLAVAANGTGNNLSVLIGNGDGTFRNAVSYASGTGTSPWSIVTADINGDGKLDLAVANQTGNSVSILPGKGDGTFYAAVTYGLGASARNLAAGDFNGDGYIDLAVATTDNNVTIILGNGNFTFQPPVKYAAGTGAFTVAAGDFNGDGRLDLAVANYSSNNVSILIGNGDGTFMTAVNYTVGTTPYSVATGDFNGDGKLDLVAGNYGTNNVSVLMGNGDGTFSPAVGYTVGTAPYAVTTGDFNGDGKLDLAVANTSSNNVSILAGMGNGTFQAAVNYPTGAWPASITTGDFNRDGRTDLAVAAITASQASVLLNDALFGKLSLTTAGTGTGIASGGGTYDFGTVHQISAFAATGSTFTGWSGDCSGTASPLDVTMFNRNMSCTANFTQNTHTLTVNKNGTGSGTVGGSGTFDYGTVNQVSATALTGSTFTGWSGDCSGSANPFNVTMLDRDMTCTATFTLITHTLTVTATGAGSGTVSGGGTFPLGTVNQVSATASTGSTFTGWSGDCSGSTSTFDVTMVDRDMACTAAFLLNQTITFSPLTPRILGDADFDPGATASSGLSVSYTSSNTAVATIVNGKIHLVGPGTTTITASQGGNSSWVAAADVPQQLSVSVHPPILTAPTVTNRGAGSATLILQSDSTGTGYFTVLPGTNATCGTGEQTKAGLDSTDAPALRFGSLPLAANVAGNYTVRTLLQNSPYTVCFTADSGGFSLQSTAVKTSLTTSSVATVVNPLWKTVGNAGFSQGSAGDISLAVAPDGSPYVAYGESGRGDKATVMKFNGTSWGAVGNAGFSTARAGYTFLAFSPDGTPYVAFQDAGNSDKATVMTFGSGSWRLVGSAGFSSGAALYPRLAFAPDGTPYVAFFDNSTYKATVMKYQGSWIPVGSTSFPDASTMPLALAFAPDGTPHLAYEETGSSTVTVRKFDGANWAVLGTPGFSGSSANYISLAFAPEGTPYVAFEDDGNGGKETVMKYSGSTWLPVGNVGFSTYQAENNSLAIGPDGTPYVAYYENSFTTMVMKYDGSSWIPLRSTGISVGDVISPSLAVSPDGTPYVAFADATRSYGATVVKLTEAPLPTATTGTASSVSPIDVTLNGTVNDNGSDTTIAFDYGLTTDYGNTASAGTVPAGSGATAVSAAIGGLTCNTTYHFRVGATNVAGTVYGSDNTVTTALCPTTLSSFTRQSPTGSATNGATVTMRATFADPISGLSTTNFDLSPTITGATITAVTAVGTVPATQWDITVSTGSGEGAITPRLVTIGGITPAITTTVPFSGQAYTIDRTSPTTTPSIGSGTYNGQQAISLTCNDGTGSGCASTFYCLGTGCSPATQYSGAITIFTTTDLRYYSVDNAGNSEPVNTASYTIDTYYPVNLTVTGNGSGTVTSTPAGIACNTSCSADFTAGSSVSLHAEAAEFTIFSGWGGACSEFADCVLTVNGVNNVTAFFVKDIGHYVRCDSPTTKYYSNIANGYQAMPTAATLMLWGVDFVGNVTFNLDKVVTVKGGFNGTYSATPGLSTIVGSMTFSKGTVTVENLAVR